MVLPLLLALFGCTPRPPSIDTTGLDPAVVKVISTALEGVKQNPRSSERWGKLGSVLMHYEFRS